MAEYTDLQLSTKLPKKTEYNNSIKADEGYTAGRLNITDGVLNKDTSIYATNAISSTLSILAKYYEHQEMEVTRYTKLVATDPSKYVMHGTIIELPISTEYSVRVLTPYGYKAGTLANMTEGQKYRLFKNKFLYTLADAEPIDVMIKLPATPNQTIRVSTKTGVYSSKSDEETRYTVKYDSYYIVTVTPDEGYTKGKLNQEEGVKTYVNIDSNPLIDNTTSTINFTITAAEKTSITVSLAKYIYQDLKLSINGVNLCESDSHPFSFAAKYGDRYTLKNESNIGYVPGALYQPSSGILTKDITFTAAEAVEIKTGVIMSHILNDTDTTKVDTTQSFSDWYSHYYDFDRDDDGQVDGDTLEYITNTLDNNHVSQQLHTDFKGEMYPTITPYTDRIERDNKGLTDGYFIPSRDIDYYKNDSTAQSLTNAVVGIQQSPNQLITVTYNGKTYTEEFIVPLNSTIKASLSLSDTSKYIKGTLSIAENTNVTITKNTVISATSAMLKFCNINIEKYELQQIIATYNGTEYTSGFVVPNGAKVTVTIRSLNEKYDAGDLNYTSLTVTESVILHATAAKVKSCAVAVNNNDSKKIKITYLGKLYYKSFIVNYGDEIYIDSNQSGFDVNTVIKSGAISQDIGQVGYTIKGDTYITVP